jgi:hypothetical protein
MCILFKLLQLSEAHACHVQKPGVLFASWFTVMWAYISWQSSFILFTNELYQYQQFICQF